jgi:hypothetical protein
LRLCCVHFLVNLKPWEHVNVADKLGTKITLSEVASLQQAIEQAPTKSPTEVSKRQAIGLLAPKLYEMRAKGYAWRDVAALLSEHGLTVTVSALQRHLRAAKGRAPNGVRRRAAGSHSAASQAGKTAPSGALTLIDVAPVPPPAPLKSVPSSGQRAPDAKVRSTEPEKRGVTRIGRRLLVRRDDLLSWLNERRAASPGGTRR